MDVEFVAQPDSDRRLGDFLDSHLTDSRWTTFRAAVAFVKQSGVRHIESAMAAFSERADVRISVGISCGGTSLEGLSMLYDAVGENGEIWIFHNEIGSTFHPKVYLFRNDTEAHIAIGSGNLTAGGLYTNYEATFVVSLNLPQEADARILREVEAALDEWSNPSDGTARKLDDALLDQLAANAYLPPEVYSRTTEEAGTALGTDTSTDDTSDETTLFAAVPVNPAPARATTRPVPAPTALPHTPGTPAVFYMTLQHTDVGRGQVTAGTAARSPEIFVPRKRSARP